MPSGPACPSISQATRARDGGGGSEESGEDRHTQSVREREREREIVGLTPAVRLREVCESHLDLSADGRCFLSLAEVG